ncbi:SNF2-related protein [Salisediminibacterium selenitireducens]|uniref:SNF2-related protein n=1 Tax=Bacillus selenitireducens (strain ATCC 700615 / DSM 15326 / MLS10) TaxID=439292 RepID=D6Y000_BACIE|nr:DEAD/DEAH box helicase [Salisediminibacterium selenitireducens]ADI00502.1 SNF2-related protein [[Bacillus] selenitireducens MLS10]
MNYTPYHYQEMAKTWMMERAYAGLFLDMGMGKTVITLTAIDDLLYDYFDVSRVLIIAPLRVARVTWTEEVEKWSHLNDLKVTKILGSLKERKAALDDVGQVAVINRENVTWLVDYLGKDWLFDMVVIDELSSFKSSKAKRFRSLKKVRPFIKRLVGLTGTPSPNSLLDLWPQIYLLDQGERLGRTFSGFRERYFLPDKRNQQTIFSWKLKEGSEHQIYELLEDLCISMKASDYLDVPERIDNTVPVELPPKAKRAYTQLEKEWLLAFEDADVLAGSAAVVANKLLQLANGAIYDETGDVQEVHDEKLEALKELIESANGKPVLVYYNYQHDRDRILKHLKAFKPRVLKTDQDIRDWNKGNVPVLLAHPASAGHGLNLQAGGHVMVWFGLNWSLELYQQANARLHRQGQTETVVVHHLITKGTMDERVMAALKQKDTSQEALIAAVKAKRHTLKEVNTNEN